MNSRLIGDGGERSESLAGRRSSLGFPAGVNSTVIPLVQSQKVREFFFFLVLILTSFRFL